MSAVKNCGVRFPSDRSKTYPRKCLNCCRQEQGQTKGHHENPLPLAVATRQRPRFHLNALPHTHTLTHTHTEKQSNPASPSPSQPSRWSAWLTFMRQGASVSSYRPIGRMSWLIIGVGGRACHLELSLDTRLKSQPGLAWERECGC